MVMTRTHDVTPSKPIRLWPGVIAAVLLVVVRLIVPAVFPDGGIVGVLGALVAGLLIVLWWLFFSRAPWSERLGALLLMVVAGFAARYVIDESIRGGMMGMMLPMYLAIPGLSFALVVWAAATRHLAKGPRRAALVATMLLACGAFAMLRTDGIVGGGVAQLRWRWTPTAEERLLAQAPAEPAAAAAPAASAIAPSQPAPAATSERATAVPPEPAVSRTARSNAEPNSAITPPVHAPGPGVAMDVRWPGFRGAARNSHVPGVRIETDWTKSAPTELWRRPIGPGWSSFAVAGEILYTQEQRGDDEVVAAYSVTTGKPVWMHRDRVRFYESNGGAGPRATPSVHGGRVYTLGATGILNALDARSGARVWSRNAAVDAGVKVPGWGIAGSPLVVDDLVVAAASGALVAYDRGTGERRWRLESEGGSYSSPHLFTVAGTPQIVLMAGAGLTSVSPPDGTVLWKHAWKGSPIVQPAQTAEGDLLISTADSMGGLGLRRIGVTKGPGGWSVEERWTSRGLKPYFNDLVVHEGHACGFDGSILACIDLTNGERVWKGGRYGNGQLALLRDQGVMLVLSEEGELALVTAGTDKYTELARFKALEGKTWNHPVVVGDILLVRNGEEMAAFRMPLAAR